jgi:hypothetical protein
MRSTIFLTVVSALLVVVQGYYTWNTIDGNWGMNLNWDPEVCTVSKDQNPILKCVAKHGRSFSPMPRSDSHDLILLHFIYLH